MKRSLAITSRVGDNSLQLAGAWDEACRASGGVRLLRALTARTGRAEGRGGFHACRRLAAWEGRLVARHVAGGQRASAGDTWQTAGWASLGWLMLGFIWAKLLGFSLGLGFKVCLQK